MKRGITIVKRVVEEKKEEKKKKKGSEVGSARSTGGRHYYGLVFRPHAQHPHTRTRCFCASKVCGSADKLAREWPASCKRVIRHAKSFPGIELPGIGWKEAAGPQGAPRAVRWTGLSLSLSRSVAAATIATQKRCWIFERCRNGVKRFTVAARSVLAGGVERGGATIAGCTMMRMACRCGRVGGKRVLFSPSGRSFFPSWGLTRFIEARE